MQEDGHVKFKRRMDRPITKEIQMNKILILILALMVTGCYYGPSMGGNPYAYRQPIMNPGGYQQGYGYPYGMRYGGGGGGGGGGWDRR